MDMLLPITHIMLGDGDARYLVQPMRTYNGVKRGELYRILAIDTHGNCSIAKPADLTQMMVGPKGHWYPLEMFAWMRPGIVADPANDNA